MSFSSSIKNQLCSLKDINTCCYHAQSYGLLLFSHFSKLNLSISTENENIFNLYCSCLRDYCGVNPVINQVNKKKLTAYVNNKDDQIKIFKRFSHGYGERTLRINSVNMQQECCVNAFLRGAFLACGSVTEPERGYHLEFVVPYKHLSDDLVTIFNELELKPKTVMRKGNNVIYFKDSESIEDFLALIGADDASLYLMNVKIEKDVKNAVNRRLNFELSNFNKTLAAANEQYDAIMCLKLKGKLDLLPDGLKELAVLRLENPEATLNEINNMLSVPLSKSGVNHRFSRLIQLSKE
ncbi:MAG: DNA-binding protein WhiA [Clostridiales bacterium]|nr:DNA-binding protein WhiA [Clostridiales bacterium]